IQEVNKAQIIKPPYLQVQSNGNLVMCNTHMRLADEHQHSFGIIVNENCIMLNEDCIIFDESPKGTCCKAIPKLLLNLPEALRTQINEVGGMGCIYLPGPLFKRGQQ
ncbi:MAG: hypothetical protein M1536_06600, partial [Firmicutes bacterium]|nr:hypothetical protein [Bacillota bacterium]